MPDPLYWRLAYPDDHVEDEPADNASILYSRPGAVFLYAMRPTTPDADPKRREPAFMLPLFDDETGQKYKPLWYRRRNMSLDPNVPNALEYTVVGRGTFEVLGKTRAQRRREAKGEPPSLDVRFDGQLKASADGETWIDCPQAWIDEAAISNLIVNSA